MNVKELIKELLEYDPNAEISLIINTDDGDVVAGDVDKIEKNKHIIFDKNGIIQKCIEGVDLISEYED